MKFINISLYKLLIKVLIVSSGRKILLGVFELKFVIVNKNFIIRIMIRIVKEKFFIVNEVISLCLLFKICGNRILRIIEINKGIMILNFFLSYFCFVYKF